MTHDDALKLITCLHEIGMTLCLVSGLLVSIFVAILFAGSRK